MNIVVCICDYLYNRIDSNFVDKFIHIQNNIHKVNSNINLKVINNNFIKVKYARPDIIYLLEVDGLIHYKRIIDHFHGKVPIVLVVDDIFHLSVYNDDVKSVCSAVTNTMKASHLLCQVKERVSPNISHVYSTSSQFVNINLFHSWDQEKIYDILIYGTTNVKLSEPFNDYDKIAFDNGERSFYPLRKRLKNLLLKKWRGKFKVKCLKEPSFYKKTKSSICGEELSKLINQSYLCISTRTIENFMVKKYLEIAASDTVILGDIPTDYKNMYKGNIVEVNLDNTDEEIYNILCKALGDKEKLINMGKEFGKYVRKYHCYDCAIPDYIDISKKVLGRDDL